MSPSTYAYNYACIYVYVSINLCMHQCLPISKPLIDRSQWGGTGRRGAGCCGIIVSLPLPDVALDEQRHAYDSQPPQGMYYL